MVGRPLSCDEQTYNCTRLEYARVCVEADVALPFIHQFEIESSLSSDPILIQVEYEWKPPRCDKCNIFGHVCAKEKSTEKIPGNISDGIPMETIPNSKEGEGVPACTSSKNIEEPDGAGKNKQTGGQVNGKGNAGLVTKIIESGDGFTIVSKTGGVRKPVGKAPVDNRRPQQYLVQQPKQPVGLCSNVVAITGSNRGDETEDEDELDKESANDEHSVEENQLLITGFAKCVESKMATLQSASEASTSATDDSKETTSLPRGNPFSPFTKQVGKKKGKKLRLAKGL